MIASDRAAAMTRDRQPGVAAMLTTAIEAADLLLTPEVAEARYADGGGRE